MEVSFSYGRALQAAALSAWQGQDANAGAGQKAYLHRARMNGLARGGQLELRRRARRFLTELS